MSREGRNRQRPTKHDVTKVHWHFLRNSSHFLTIQLSTIQPLAIVKFAIYRRPVDSQLINKQSTRSTRFCKRMPFRHSHFGWNEMLKKYFSWFYKMADSKSNCGWKEWKKTDSCGEKHFDKALCVRTFESKCPGCCASWMKGKREYTRKLTLKEKRTKKRRKKWTNKKENQRQIKKQKRRRRGRGWWRRRRRRRQR